MRIAIIDYDAGNTKSVSKALDFIGIENTITAAKKTILEADGIILPGVGAFPQAMAALEERDLIAVLQEVVAHGKPLLGVCLGMQLLLDSSEEFGYTQGLGLIPGHAKSLPDTAKIPHMGWNRLEVKQDSPLTRDQDGNFVYYVHSYYAVCEEKYVLASSDYSMEVPGIIANENVYGAQFHPEKSGQAGLEILQGFKEVIACGFSQQ
ncbi:imidazole glycerol phosphate synthase subunit HisH [Listeria newyorkensis]|uniref:Imidazole glycerol phosphate synthase subunit HisH n=1 Tax=Listeria newyorkensis TaxID=1497681 RepID=A0ABX4XMW3_9LIST|nr:MULTISPECIES: imidazole glycerol phosphate synthase subunit HisH [Listeria]KMT61989.1 imidazole glycerol phosphate synthase subunit HisH [Listeria newyorkensis]PNP92120.1 imidazole glycerol phosphate synthase subunit HisH [Listeria newyorkensis]RQW65922.1 imidazole glycerol phosphate synthase subunit HisH [Listeria sp. SHR_NRA_18]WAO20267.1 imidazole glycerol phosphate synthase subunit HisH [Listeria newyorkensis]SQC54765.1 Imidazole glycerol phosphate synthase subunit HisH 1 [Listeria newy